MTPDVQPRHGMVPGSNERPGGPECRCGAAWSRWDGRCDAQPRESIDEACCRHSGCMADDYEQRKIAALDFVEAAYGLANTPLGEGENPRLRLGRIRSKLRCVRENLQGAHERAVL